MIALKLKRIVVILVKYSVWVCSVWHVTDMLYDKVRYLVPLQFTAEVLLHYDLLGCHNNGCSAQHLLYIRECLPFNSHNAVLGHFLNMDHSEIGMNSRYQYDEVIRFKWRLHDFQL